MFRLVGPSICSNAKRTRNVSLIHSHSLWGFSQASSTMITRGVRVQGHVGPAGAAIPTPSCGVPGDVPSTTGPKRRQIHHPTARVMASPSSAAASSRGSTTSSFGSLSQSSAAMIMSLAMSVSCGYYFLVQQPNVCARLEEEPASALATSTAEEEAAAGEDSLLPVYTSEDVARHNSTEDGSQRIWMSYGGYVYDVTDFIPNHPGGTEKILLAAGSHVEPYWDTYRQHFSSLLPLQYLEAMKIGILDEQDQQRIDDQMEKETISPYAYEPVRNPELIIHTEQPANMETPYTKLTDQYITPSELFYIRSHAPVPHVTQDDIENFRLTIDTTALGVPTILELTLDQLKSMPRHEIVATLQCSGNRRAEFNTKSQTSGTPWYQGAISTAKWSGVRLRDILKAAGIDDDKLCQNLDAHVRFATLDDFHSSITIDKAYSITGDCIVAYEMNGEPIPGDHGFPFRLIVPGYIGVRNVKWLDRITVHKEEAEGPFQRGLNYKILPPSVQDASSVDLSKFPSMYEPSVFSGITQVSQQGNKFQCEDGSEAVEVVVKGWAWAGGGRNIARVDITGDGGITWTSAEITEGGNQPFNRAWAWVFWTATLPHAPVKEHGLVQIASKAVDAAYNSQVESPDPIWNIRGLSNNSWFQYSAKCA